MNDLITVIIPVYNVEPYFDRCMQSVLKQTYTNLEIILIDDKSSDRSNQMCLEYEKYDSRVKVVHGENKGLSGARNIGLAAALGKYVVFIDSDDFISFEMINNLYNRLLETDADTVVGGFRRAIGKNIVEHPNPLCGKIFADQNDIKNCVLKKMLGDNGIDHLEMSVWKILFSMDIIRNYHLRFPDKKYLCEDIIFDFDYYPLSKKLAISNDNGYCYCLNEESLSQMYQKNKAERILFQTLEMRKRAQEIGFDEEAYLRIDNFYIGNLIHHMKTMAANRKIIGKDTCLNSYREIVDNILFGEINWNGLLNTFKGRDKIPFFFLKKKMVKSMYVYLSLLTSVRGMLR